MRYKITLAYIGTNFYGWQKQNGVPSVQEEVEKALLSFTRTNIKIMAAGRTDHGVHANQQVIHADLPKEYAPEMICNALNHFLQDVKICILQAEKVEAHFHARFSAIAREYLYRIMLSPRREILHEEYCWVVPPDLNAYLMQEGADILCGTHDFSAFRNKHCQAKSPVKRIDYFTVNQQGNIIDILIGAPSFLHNQVRIMVGTLYLIGKSKMPPSHIYSILSSKDRKNAYYTAPPHGLYLNRICY